MKRSGIGFLLAFFVVLFTPSSSIYAQTFEVRKDILQRVAEQAGLPYFAKIAAKIKTHFKEEEAYRQLDTLLSLEKGDMFWMYGCAGLYYSCKKELPKEYRDKVRSAWKLCTPYRGDTDNHFLMYYSSLYLMAQEWSDLPEREWFIGKSSKQIIKESQEYLEHWIENVAHDGMTEFDSPRYMYYYITPLILLTEYAQDENFRTKCEMMLEYVLADYANDYYFGNYAGAHSRVGFDQALDSRKTETASYGQYFFEDSVSLVMPDIAFAAMGKFECPAIIRLIATKKSYPFSSEEIAQGRKKIRNPDGKREVRKRLYATNAYALGSLTGGLVSPIQQQSWTLTINTDKPNNVITGLHPYVSSDELGMFFPEEPEWQLEKIEKVKTGYSSEDKLIGGSPFEHISQNKNELFCSYQGVPASAKYQHVDIIIPKWLSHDSSGLHSLQFSWDSVIVKITTSNNYKLIEDDNKYRMRVPIVNGVAEYSVHCFTPNEFRSGYSSSYISSLKDSGVIKLKYGNQTRILNFPASRIIVK